MKLLLLVNCIFIAFLGQAQIDTSNAQNLIKLGELYSNNINAQGDHFQEAIESLRTTELNHIIDALILIGKGDKKLLTSEFLKRPSNEELRYWYVLREIHYNMTAEEKRSNEEVANEFLTKDIDERWLLDNYYYRINTGIAQLFNTEDLSDFNIELDSFELKNDTEKAILYFGILAALTQRFKVLQMLKNHDKLLEFADRMPRFNGAFYYEYVNFDFKDFDWIGHEKVESYKARHVGNLYATLIAHFSTLENKKLAEERRKLYFRSVLFLPKYFEYTPAKNDLQKLYENLKK